MKRRARIVSGLAALAALFLAPLAEASLTRATSPAPEASALTLASPAPELSEFSLFEGNELARALAAPRVGVEVGRFHPLAAVSLLDEDARLDLGSGHEPRFPKTRIGVFDFLGSRIIWVETELSLELQWGSGRFGLKTSEGIGNFLTEDPLDDVDSPNVYGFVAGRPHEFTDPEGLFSGWSAAKEGAKTLGRNLAIIGGIGVVTGVCPPCGVALAVAATGYLAYGVQTDVNARLKQGQNGAQAAAGALGNITGIGGISEGITNKDFATGAELNLTDEEREKRVGEGAGNLLSWFAGPKVFRGGAKLGAGSKARYQGWSASENTWPSIKPEGGWEFEGSNSQPPVSGDDPIAGPGRMLTAGRETTLTREQVARFQGTGAERGRAFNQYLVEAHGGRAEVGVETQLGRRVQDVGDMTVGRTEFAVEGKNYLRFRTVGGSRVRGQVPLSPEIQAQIYKDVLWVRRGRLQGIHRVMQWEFAGAGPSTELEGALRRWGIPYVR